MSDPVEEILRRLDAIDQKQDRTWRLLADSTVEGGSVIDTIRKHDAQIRELQGNSLLAFCGRHALGTAITIAITVLAAIFGRGFIVSIIAEAQKVAIR